jgi:acetyltransferase-like isoleucine patch superfamily enzyme
MIMGYKLHKLLIKMGVSQSKIEYCRKLYCALFIRDTNKRNNLVKGYKRIKKQNNRKNERWFPESFIEIGKFSGFSNKPNLVYWGEQVKLEIGKFTSIGADVTIRFCREHIPDWLSTYNFQESIHTFSPKRNIERSKGNIIIGNDVWIGTGVTIMPGVKIGNGAIIGTKAVVTKSVPDYEIWGGIPARKLKNRFSDEITEQLKMIKWWDWPDQNICDVIQLLQSNDIESLKNYFIKNIKK